MLFLMKIILPHRAFGTPVQLSNGSSVGEGFKFLSDHNFTLPNDLRLENVKKNDKHINLHFKQYHNDIEVIDSRLYAKLSLNDSFLVFGLDIFNDITISPRIQQSLKKLLYYLLHQILQINYEKYGRRKSKNTTSSN